MIEYGHEFAFIGMLFWLLVIGAVVYLVVHALSAATQRREHKESAQAPGQVPSPKQRTGITDWTVRDPVCGTEGPASGASAHVEYGGRVYFFCSDACRDVFLQSPDRYAPKRPATSGPHSHQHAPAR